MYKVTLILTSSTDKESAFLQRLPVTVVSIQTASVLEDTDTAENTNINGHGWISFREKDVGHFLCSSHQIFLKAHPIG